MTARSMRLGLGPVAWYIHWPGLSSRCMSSQGTPAWCRKRAKCMTQSCSLRIVGPKCAETLPLAFVGCFGHSGSARSQALMPATASAICSSSGGFAAWVMRRG